MKKWIRAVLIVLLVLEVVSRFAPPQLLPPLGTDSAEHALFAHDQELGWFPRPNQAVVSKRERTIMLKTNSRGFRDTEWREKTKPRLVFLGDSFVWGFDVEEEERFSNLLRAQFSAWDILNAGIVGYGTDQELLLLRKYYDLFQPDIVFLVFVGANDPLNNISNFQYGLYKPYFTQGSDSLTMQGVPVAHSIFYTLRKADLIFRISYLLRAMAGAISSLMTDTITIPDLTKELILEIKWTAEQRGARFILGYESISPELLTQLTAAGVASVDLSSSLRYQSYGLHWTAEGHKEVAARIANQLEKFLASPN